MRGPSYARDSDASFASNSRPSVAGMAPKITDKQAAIRQVNAYLASHNFRSSLSLKHLPSARDISEIFQFLFSRLQLSGFSKLEEDLPVLLKYLNCPHKPSKSAIRAPGTPHAFPHLLAVIHWLSQLADYSDHISYPSSASASSSIEDAAAADDLDTMSSYAFKSYNHFMRGEDDAVDALNQDFTTMMEREKESLRSSIESSNSHISDLESKLLALRSGPSPLQALEAQKDLLEKDVNKFTDYVRNLEDGIELTEKALAEKAKELEAKVVEYGKICHENDDLRKKVEAQGIDIRGAEMIKRELKTVEREIDEADSSRRTWEEKSWDLDSKIGTLFKDTEKLSVECNQALRRLKLRSELQYASNPKGTTVADVLGIDYKSTLKPSINSLSHETKQSSIKNSEEVVALQKQIVDVEARIQAKTNRKNEIQQQILESETQVKCLKKEVEDFRAHCHAEATSKVEELEAEASKLEIMDREAKETLKGAELKLLEAETQSEDEIQKCAYELFTLIDSVSKHKEYIELKISEMGNALAETAESITDVHNRTLSAEYSISLDSPQ